MKRKAIRQKQSKTKEAKQILPVTEHVVVTHFDDKISLVPNTTSPSTSSFRCDTFLWNHVDKSLPPPTSVVLCTDDITKTRDTEKDSSRPPFMKNIWMAKLSKRPPACVCGKTKNGSIFIPAIITKTLAESPTEDLVVKNKLFCMCCDDPTFVPEIQATDIKVDPTGSLVSGIEMSPVRGIQYWAQKPHSCADITKIWTVGHAPDEVRGMYETSV